MYQKTLILTFLLLGSLLFYQCQKKEDSPYPNIIFILADDMGYGDPGCYNPGSKIPTPNINSIAREGMRFTNAHAPGTWCVPTRYGLLTGRYPVHVNTADIDHTALIEEDQITIAGLLKSHGYSTGMVGKWHLGFLNGDSLDYSKPLRGGPVDHGFDYFFGIPASLDIPPYYYIENDRCVQPPTDSIGPSHTAGYYPIQGAFWREGKVAPDFIHSEVLPTLTDKAITFIQSQDPSSSSPFFLYLALTAPHTPWLPSESFQDSSGAGLYGDFTVQVDHSVGLVLKELDQLGLEDNTLVFFTSDNGPVWYERDSERFDHQSTHYLRGMKADAYEGGHRMPFLAKWPGHIRAGTHTRELICFTDMLATFSDLLDHSLPSLTYKESASILPVLLGEKYPPQIKNEVIIEDWAVIQHHWKFIKGNGSGWISNRYKKEDHIEKDVQGELYHLEEDSTETRNLYFQYPEKVVRMKSVLDSYTHSQIPSQ